MNDSRTGSKKNFSRRESGPPGKGEGRGLPQERGKTEFNKKNPDRRRSDQSAPGSPDGATGALIALDRDLMKLLVRRATLVSRIRGGRDHASTPAAIQAEKAVRIAWETGALSFSKDPRFSRQLFTLLQDLKVLRKEQAELFGSYHLSPAAKPLSGALTGPTATRTAQMRLALAACLGKALKLHPVMFSDALTDTCKACEQAGSRLSRQNNGPGRGTLLLEGGAASFLGERSLYLGEDLFTLYLMVFLNLGRTGVWRLNGGARLKSADLAPLRHALPLFGARLGHVVPRSQGLPANLECSGVIPPHVLVPADFPQEALSALLLAPLAWNLPVTLDLSSLPAAAATAALAEVRPLHRDSGAEVETYGPKLIFTPGPVTPPEEPVLPLDPVLCAYLLCLPAFAGGTLELQGNWPSRMPEAAEAEQLFSWAGLAYSIEEKSIRAALPSQDDITAGRAKPAFSMPMQNNDISPGLGPLFLALSALCLKRTGTPVPLRRLLSFPVEETGLLLAQDFFARLDLEYDGDLLQSPECSSSEKNDAASMRPAPEWTSPDAFWSMAFALSAFVRPGLHLANPGNVTEVMPPFWGIYNSLPAPVDPGAVEKKPGESESVKTARRRIITD